MKKIWVYKRTGIKGWWVGWYESGKRKAKALPSKKLAEHYCQLKYSQLNSDVFTGIVPIKSLNDAQVKKLMSVTEPYRSIKMRILLALATGLTKFYRLKPRIFYPGEVHILTSHPY